MLTAMATRVEHDAFGWIEVPADRYWGAQTQRALAVFAIGDVGSERLPACLVRTCGLQKRFDDHFPLPAWQTGSGTQTNMNANEVIANRGNELLGAPLGTRSPVHPNDHVNRGQSPNDSFPTMMHIVAVLELTDRLLPALAVLHGSLAAKASAFAGIIKIGRTHLQDAVPMMMGQGFGAYAQQVQLGIERVQACLPHLYPLAKGLDLEPRRVFRGPFGLGHVAMAARPAPGSGLPPRRAACCRGVPAAGDC
jgi:fumarate hydratase, class II